MATEKSVQYFVVERTVSNSWCVSTNVSTVSVCGRDRFRAGLPVSEAGSEPCSLSDEASSTLSSSLVEVRCWELVNVWVLLGDHESVWRTLTSRRFLTAGRRSQCTASQRDNMIYSHVALRRNLLHGRPHYSNGPGCNSDVASHDVHWCSRRPLVGYKI